LHQKLIKQIKNRETLSTRDALVLYHWPLWKLARYALEEKERRFSQKITYIRNYYMNYTNICKYACQYCGFRRNAQAKDAYSLTIDQIKDKLSNTPETLQEVWFSSALNPDLPFQYYLDLIRMVKSTHPYVQLKAFTAVEIDFFSKHFRRSIESILDEFFSAGLDCLSGGGAEIFDKQIRKQIDIKTSPEEYLSIHRLCHQRGIKTNVTMLFGHVETLENRVNHLLKIRDFQEKNSGFQAFIPLVFQDKHNPLAKKGIKSPHSIDILKTLAISRLLLSNVPHIQAFWPDLGIELTQISLACGVDDINGTLIEENIAHESGSTTNRYEPHERLVEWIQGAGCVAVERDTQFRRLTPL